MIDASELLLFGKVTRFWRAWAIVVVVGGTVAALCWTFFTVDHRSLWLKSILTSGDGASFLRNVPKEFQPDNFQLYVRLNFAKSWNELRSCALPSLQLFWPHPHILVALDGGSPRDESEAPRIAGFVTKNFPPLKARGVLVADYPQLKGAKYYAGWQRGQLDMMYADTVVTSKYVGLLDSDALFVTLVTPPAIFSQDGRPVVIASVARPYTPGQEFWRGVPHGVQLMLKKPMAVGCMSSFPVVFATKHLAEMRAHVEKVNGRPFLQVYRELAGRGYYCHFTIMCNFMWHFHRDEYDWHIMNFAHRRGDWKKPLPGEVAEYDFLTAKNTRPFIRVSTHFSYTSFGIPFDMPDGDLMVKHGWMKHLHDKLDVARIRPMLVHSFCYSALAQCRTQTECDSLTQSCYKIGAAKDQVQSLLFRFETTQTWEWEQGLLQAQLTHYKSVKDFHHWISYAKYILNRHHQSAYDKLILK